MDIHALIEVIATCSDKYGRFYFTLQEMNSPMSPMYATAVDCNGKEVARCDYFGLFTEEKIISNANDAIAFLFDCDIYMWQLVAWDIQLEGGCDGQTTTWSITLRR